MITVAIGPSSVVPGFNGLGGFLSASAAAPPSLARFFRGLFVAIGLVPVSLGLGVFAVVGFGPDLGGRRVLVGVAGLASSARATSLAGGVFFPRVAVSVARVLAPGRFGIVVDFRRLERLG